MFERYTESARRALFFARYEASQLGHLTIETEHLLLGVVREGVARQLVPVDLDEVRREIESRMPFHEKVSTSVEIPFSAATKRVLQFAVQEADLLGVSYIGCEHLLLGLLREEHSIAASILTARGAHLGDLRAKVRQQPRPAELEPGVSVRLAFEQIKQLVEELGGLAPDAAAAGRLVAEINAALDALSGGPGIR